jgi:hypothetical protein
MQQDLLRAQRDLRRFFSGKAKRLIVAVGVQTLGSSEYGRERFEVANERSSQSRYLGLVPASAGDAGDRLAARPR